MVITYQTFVLERRRYTILVDTCTGEDKGHRRHSISGKERWRNELFRAGNCLRQSGLRVLHASSYRPYRLNTTLRDGRWVPTFPNAKYVFHRREYAAWEAEHARGANPPGTVFRDNCLPSWKPGRRLWMTGKQLSGIPCRAIAPRACSASQAAYSRL